MPVHGTLASIRTWFNHSFSVLVKFWRELSARTRPQSPLLGAQARWQHASRHQQGRLQQLTLGGVLAMFVLALLYFDSGSSRRRDSTAVAVPKSSDMSEDQVPMNLYARKSGVDGKALCRALSQMQVCSHRSSLGQSDKLKDTPFLERMARLAASGIVCYDIDVIATADGQLVVGYPNHIATELRAAGRMVAPGQLDTVPWSDYVSAGLDKRHPLLQDVLAVFMKIVTSSDLGQDAVHSGGVGRETVGTGNDATSEGSGVMAAEAVLRGEADGSISGGDGGGAVQLTAATMKDGRHVGDEAGAQGVQQKEQQQQQQEREEAVTIAQMQGQEGKDGMDKQSEQRQKQRRQRRQPPVQTAQTQQQQQEAQTKQQSTPVVEEQQQQVERDQRQGQQQAGQGRRRLYVLQEQGGGDKAAAQQQQGQKAEDPHGQGPGSTEGWAHPTPLLLVELKESAMRVSAAEVVHNATRALGIQSHVGLWLPRLSRVEGPSVEHSGGQGQQIHVQAVSEHLQRLGSGLLKVLGLPDTRRLTDGTRVPLPLMLQHGDAATYSIFGPSIKHSDAALAEVVTAAAGQPVVTWVVDGIDEAMRVARAGGGFIVANEPLLMRSRLQAVSATCSGAVDGEAAAANAKAAVADQAAKTGEVGAGGGER
ncbi:hypothetical protein Vretimale_16097 [Volvox reticuliferus]|uniref:Uncharacterized protein n=1 Tax=Volvox reticuliferus TaxID=1737510 RepID=A0A8J4FLT9_9CHLO|nr:hypothetical protein Vretifemale_9674 [Volvox reticuliferus]GIM12863.1 hypothetical protein Vretimale_16097 [Volvox reticuliferus]